MDDDEEICFEDLCGIPQEKREDFGRAAITCALEVIEVCQNVSSKAAKDHLVLGHEDAVAQLSAVLVACWLTEDLGMSWGWDESEVDIQTIAIDRVEGELMGLLRQRREFVRQWKKEKGEK